ncbi:MAG: tagatose kinase [Thermosipho sp. (in: thermotogales)]|jgi:sugar/nucleoside kinase (ribokinase family)|nr:tagatose kinase [Thermosipho sp. (in: thermotogales)]
MPHVITIGEVLVEFMAKNIDQKFYITGEFTGPYPSGAPAIFIDQVAKLGTSGGIISKVGFDDFGKLNYDRLKSDGVDVKYFSFTNEGATGVAFVSYKSNGDRDFIFHLKNSATGFLNIDDIHEEYFDDCNFYHIMGSSLFNGNIRNAVEKAISIAKKNNIKISFDPNLRKEILQDESYKNFINYILEECHIFLPSEEELKLITGIEDEETSIHFLLDKGIEYIVVKRGKKGCTVYDKNNKVTFAPIKVEEIDPTGAGDCFDGTFISFLDKGFDVNTAALYANAAGAIAVTRKGPMEGTSTLREVEEFLKSQSNI